MTLTQDIDKVAEAITGRHGDPQVIEAWGRLRDRLEGVTRFKVRIPPEGYGICDMCSKDVPLGPGWTWEAGAFSFCPACSESEDIEAEAKARAKRDEKLGLCERGCGQPKHPHRPARN